MPGPIIQQQPLPEWLTGPSDARGRAAVGQAFLRGLVSMLGLDDPKQIVGVGMPIDVGASSGGLIDAVATRFPRFAQAIKSYMSPTVGGQVSPPFYSRLDEAVQTLPKQTFGPKIAGIPQKGLASSEELTARKIPQFIEAAGNKPIQRAALEAHLAEHPVPQLDVRVLESNPSLNATLNGVSGRATDLGFSVRERLAPLSQLDRMNAPNWAYSVARGGELAEDSLAKINRLPITPELRADLLEYGRVAVQSHDLNERFLASKPKYAQYQLPGGENYRETLITLPDQGEAGFQKLLKQRDAVDAQIEAYHQARGDDRFAPHPPELVKQYNALQDQINAMQNQQFRSSHFDEPNVLVHTRSNERDLPGLGHGTFLEEVQSDWHQQGKSKGYQPAPLSAQEKQRLVTLRPSVVNGTATSAERAEWQGLVNRNEATGTQVPNAPFKETWPDLALKHHIIEAAQDPKTQWLGFTSGETQAARYDLSKQVKSIDYRRTGPPDKPVFQLGAVDMHGDGVPLGAKDTFTAAELPDVVGKELAQKIIDGQGKPGGGRMTLSGIDLKVGGEGMREFYDKLLPKRLEKIVKPFGGTVERMTPQQTGNADLVGSWMVRLTPEMKAKILRTGIPLMTGLGAVGLQQEQGK